MSTLNPLKNKTNLQLLQERKFKAAKQKVKQDLDYYSPLTAIKVVEKAVRLGTYWIKFTFIVDEVGLELLKEICKKHSLILTNRSISKDLFENFEVTCTKNLHNSYHIAQKHLENTIAGLLRLFKPHSLPRPDIQVLFSLTQLQNLKKIKYGYEGTSIHPYIQITMPIKILKKEYYWRLREELGKKGIADVIPVDVENNQYKVCIYCTSDGDRLDILIPRLIFALTLQKLTSIVLPEDMPWYMKTRNSFVEQYKTWFKSDDLHEDCGFLVVFDSTKKRVANVLNRHKLIELIGTPKLGTNSSSYRVSEQAEFNRKAVIRDGISDWFHPDKFTWASRDPEMNYMALEERIITRIPELRNVDRITPVTTTTATTASWPTTTTVFRPGFDTALVGVNHRNLSFIRSN